MRNIVQMSAGVLTALAMSLSLGACGAKPGTAEDAAYIDGAPQKAAVQKVSNTQTADARAAANRARDAEARARAAEAKAACERDRQNASNNGAVVGGLAGAVIGSQVAGHGAKSEGAVVGGLGGVLAGRQIAKKDHRC